MLVKDKRMMDYYSEREYYLASGSDIQEVFSFYMMVLGSNGDNIDFKTGQFNGNAWGIAD